MPGTRAEDSPEVAQRIKDARREGRKVTIVMAIVASGFVSLFIARVSETNAANDQVTRNRINCALIQEDRRAQVKIRNDDADFFQRQADNTLGNKDKGIKPIDLDHGPFKAFKPLILAQAADNRKRAIVARQRAIEAKTRIENCKRVFPKRHFI